MRETAEDVAAQEEPTGQMTAQEKRDVAKLQAEIKQHDKLMINGVFLTFLLMFACFIAATISGQIVLHEAVYMLAISMTFWIARGQYMIHRAGWYIRSVEYMREEGWESHLADLWSRRLLAPISAGAAISAAWLLQQSGAALQLAGHDTFVGISVMAIGLGVGAIIMMTAFGRLGW